MSEVKLVRSSELRKEYMESVNQIRSGGGRKRGKRKPMKYITLYITQEELGELDRLSEEKKVSRSLLIRKAIDKFITV